MTISGTHGINEERIRGYKTSLGGHDTHLVYVLPNTADEASFRTTPSEKIDGITMWTTRIGAVSQMEAGEAGAGAGKRGKKRKGGSSQGGKKPRLCSNCGKPGHTRRTCES